jgi:hypothetical protein
VSEVDDKTAPLGSIGVDRDRVEDETLAEPHALRQLAPPDTLEEARDDTIRPLDADEIRARRRPRAVLLVWAWELACAFFIAIPVHAWARRVWGTHPDGDAVLFRPGGHALLTWLGDDGPALSIVVRTSIAAFIVFGILGQLIAGTLIASLATGRGKIGLATKTSFALRAGASAFFPMIGIGMIALATQGLVVGIGAIVSSSVDHALVESMGDARAFTARLVVFSVFAIALGVIGVVADLVRVAVGRAAACATGGTPGGEMREAVVSAFRAARHAIGRATLAWGWRAAIALGLIYAGALAGDAVAGRGGAMLWLLFGFHQLVILVRAGLRASWFANALRLVSRPACGGSATTAARSLVLRDGRAT